MNHDVKQAFIGGRTSSQPVFLGPLEEDVMDVVWTLGTGNVRDVVGRMQRNLAYTTVMTTLDRLHKKGMLDREMMERAFVYKPKVTREEWSRRRADEMMSDFLQGPEESRQVLISCLVDAVGTHDVMLLDELERKIRSKREELAKRK